MRTSVSALTQHAARSLCRVMHSLGPSWLDPNYLLAQFGSQFIWIALLMVFVECGLIFPFLPGDSLLFATGLFIATGSLHVSFWVAVPAFCIAAFAGNLVGYEIGRLIGGPLYERDGRIVRRAYFDQTHEFFERYGNRALVLGRFVPIVRTFITIVAGAARMDRRRFLSWSLLGAVGWVVLVTLLGHLLGRVAFFQKNIEAVLVLLVLVSLVPAAFEVVRQRRAARDRT